MKPDNFLEAMNCAVEGIINALKSQRHLKIHFIAATAVLILSVILGFSSNDLVLICILIAIVIISELFNTAIENITDILKTDFHITVKYVKDVSAGAVLFCSLTSLFAGVIIFSKYIFNGGAEGPSGHFIFPSVVSLCLVFIAVIFIKASLRSGRPFKGGMPSGHAAISFSIWVSVFMYTKNIFVLSGAFIIAFLVSFSRMYFGIHKGNEVLFGAAIGGLITYFVYTIYWR